jgi:hypothetical protein
MFRIRNVVVLLVFAALLISCGHAPAVAKAEPPPSDVPHSRDADDAARFIAGMSGTPGTPFAELEKTEAWQEHRRLLDESWRKTDTSLIAGFRDFQKSALADNGLTHAQVFYPFSGPDSLTVALWFPENPVYVMVGLEPAGTLPSPSKLHAKDLKAYLRATRSTVASELGRSFFITREMDRQFRGQVTDGLLLPILHLLVRLHNTVLGFRYIRLDEQGEIIGRTADYKASTRYGNKGIEIEFQADPDKSIHRLYYFSVNLSDSRLRENQPFVTYLSRLKNTVTLLKATSYMTHKPEFSIIRDHLLANSAAILQDDSGIPFHYFKPDVWKTELFGDYDRPYGSFRWLEQKDLRSAYKSGAAKPLSMHVGYGYSRIASNLQLVKKVAQQ